MEDWIRLADIVSKSAKILIVAPQDCNLDQLAAVCGLYLALKNSGKEVVVFSSQPPTVEFSSIVAADKVVNRLDFGKIVISVEDAVQTVEKVTNFLDGDRLNLVVHPAAGKKLEVGKIKINPASFGFDLVLLFSQKRQILDKIFTLEQESSSNYQIVSVRIGNNSESFEDFDIARPNAASYSEIVVEILTKLSLTMDLDIAENLLLGIAVATANFQSSATTAASFEAAAACIKAGAKWPKEVKFSAGEPRTSQAGESKPDPDWLTPPKIYKGSDKI